MAVVDGNYLTNKGAALVAKLIGTSLPLHFVKATIGKGTLAAGVEPATMTALTNHVMDGLISSKEYKGNAQVTIGVQVLNATIGAGFWASQVGLWAQDPDEGNILYSVLILENNPIWIESNTSPVAHIPEFSLTTIVSGIQLVTAVINPASSVTMEQLEAYAAQKVHTHIITDVSGLPAALQGIRDDVYGVLDGVLHKTLNFTVSIPATGWTENADGLWEKTISDVRAKAAHVGYGVPEPAYYGKTQIVGVETSNGTIKLTSMDQPEGAFAYRFVLSEIFHEV